MVWPKLGKTGLNTSKQLSLAYEVKTILDELEIRPGYKFVSFDAASMFTSIDYIDCFFTLSRSDSWAQYDLQAPRQWPPIFQLHTYQRLLFYDKPLENENNSSYHVVRRIIRDNLDKGNLVQVLNYQDPNAVSYTEFSSNATFSCYNCYCDPWDLRSGVVEVDAKASHSWTSLVTGKDGEFNVIIINTISYALLNLSLSSVCLRLRDLKALNDGNRRIQVIGIVNMNLTSEESSEFQEINRLAESVITLGIAPNTRFLSVLHRKPLGKLVQGEYELTLNLDKRLEFAEKQKDTKKCDESKSTESAPQVLTTFKLTLDDKEKESRRQVVLPYLKNASSGGGKIIYEPDASDDWDDEDPDDDLEI